MNEAMESDQFPAQQMQGTPALSLPDVFSADTITPQAGCSSCGNAGQSPADHPQAPARLSFIYAIGKIEARFPNLAAEKEFAQVAGRTETAGKTDQQTLKLILSKRENRYLVRQLCWVMVIQGLDTYVLLPRDPGDLHLLVEALRTSPGGNDVDVVIGLRGPMAPPQSCNGLMVPMVVFDQIYSFEREALIKSIPKPEHVEANRFEPAAEELFSRIMQLADNAGSNDEHRALNYMVMRYPAIYEKAAEQFALDFSLTGVEARLTPVRSTRRIVDVIFAYTNRNTDFTQKFFVRVDVTEEFPFLVTKMSPYYDLRIGGVE